MHHSAKLIYWSKIIFAMFTSSWCENDDVYIACFVLLAIDTAPVQIILWIVIVKIASVMALPIHRALLVTIRQQLVKAKHVPPKLACSSTAP